MYSRRWLFVYIISYAELVVREQKYSHAQRWIWLLELHYYNDRTADHLDEHC